MWKAKLKNGEIVSELTHKWPHVKNEVAELLLLTKDQQVITLPKNMDKYFQSITASSDLFSKNVEIESRTIGFSLGNNTIKIRVNEKNNNISIEVEQK